MELPDADLPVVAAGGQQSRLLRVPADTVDILTMGSGHLSSQTEHGLVGIAAIFLLEHPHAVVATGGSQGTGPCTPATPAGAPRVDHVTGILARMYSLTTNGRVSPVHVINRPSVIPGQRTNTFPRQICQRGR